jgi:hypothetical protein
VFLMTRGLPVLLELGLTIFCLIDCIQTPEIEVRNLPRWAWILLILIFPLIGAIAWLVAGRPQRGGPRAVDRVTGYPEYQRERGRVVAPDDDPEFLRQVGRLNDEHEAMLQQWERDLRRREEQLRGHEDGEPPEGGGPTPTR